MTKDNNINLQIKLITSIIHSLDIIVPILFPEYENQINIQSILDSIPNSPSLDELITSRMIEAQEPFHFNSSSPPPDISSLPSKPIHEASIHNILFSELDFPFQS